MRNWLPFFIGVIFFLAMVWQGERMPANTLQKGPVYNNDSIWYGADKLQIPFGTSDGNLIWYGQELIANTSYYLGPKGIVLHDCNGMNCQNCHLAAGTLPFANNFGKVYATYPQFRARSNATQTIYGRINDCLQRSMNGVALDTTMLEMRAMYAYFKWLGQDVPKGASPAGTAIAKLPYISRAASTVEGQKVYTTACSSCHGANGQGQLNIQGTGYTYPPLWGNDSYNDGAGLFRLGSFAGYVKNNMPFGATYKTTQLTNEQAWDVAAFVNSQPRPHRDQAMDWQNLLLKPVDFPFGPYADNFTEQQHKYGPFTAIIAAQKKK